MTGPSDKSTLIKRGLTGLAVAAIVGAIFYALSPSPVPVDAATIALNDLRVTVDEEGKTRIKDVFVVSAPITGRVLRSPLEEGDMVVGAQTTVAAIEPSPPPFLDLRSRRELLAQIEAARASIDLAEAEVKRTTAELKFAENDLERARSLSIKKIVSERVLEKASIEVETKSAALARAKANKVLHERELESAIARLTGPEEDNTNSYAESCCMAVKSPVSGRVLKVLKKSKQIVIQGTPLLEIGDPEKLELVVELLSADAVRVPIGARAIVTSWGGGDLNATVSRIEPAGFTKISALGIEEQRVRVILDFDQAIMGEAIQGLGHDYRVFVRIVVQDLTDVLVVPLGALFRLQDVWTVYVIENGTAVLRSVELGHRNTEHAAVLKGLSKGEQVVLHPSDRIADGVSIVERADLN